MRNACFTFTFVIVICNKHFFPKSYLSLWLAMKGTSLPPFFHVVAHSKQHGCNIRISFGPIFSQTRVPRPVSNPLGCRDSLQTSYYDWISSLCIQVFTVFELCIT